MDALQQVGAVTAALVALGGLVLGLYKLRPESSRIFVESAEVTVRIADKRRDEAVADLAELDSKYDDLCARMNAVEDALGHEKEQRRLANSYARTLAHVLRKHHMPVPPPPDGLDLD